MSEPILENLSRFTPDAGGLDRDALIFAAGRASARASRGWQKLACLLACTQALSLAFLWPRSSPHGRGVRVDVAVAPAVQGDPFPIAPAHPGVWSTGEHPELWREDAPPADTVTLIESEPTLRAFAPAPASLLVN
jgi:hypothetical protein